MTRTPSPELLIDRLERLLPQTQCAACGYPGCRPFATALAAGEAPVGACAPGGLPLTRRLQKLLGQATVLGANALTKSLLPAPLRARITAQDCIGCTKCIEPCPVDAILGAPKQLHSVLSELCTGCGLCLPPCPVDCIELEPASTNLAWPNAADDAAVAISRGTDIAACTDCGDCARACPSALLPAPLARALAAADLDDAAALGLERCMHCGRCSEVCGERIPLADYFVQGKAVMAAVGWQAAQAAEALLRQRKREGRERPDEILAAPGYVAPPAGPQEARQEIAAALARARQRRTTPETGR